MAKYDRAITVFSPNGHLYQVEYAMEAVKKGSAAVGARGVDCIVLGVEKRAIAKLQDSRTIRKIVSIDSNITMAFAGLTADARVLVSRARVEAQSYRLTYEDDPSVEYMSRHIARTQQKYTQRGGVRPFGVASLICGFSPAGQPQLFHTDPAGTYSEWRANCIGNKNSKSLREYLEKHWREAMSREELIRLTVKSLLQVVEPGSKNMELVIVTREGIVPVEESVIAQMIEEIEREQASVAAASTAMETVGIA